MRPSILLPLALLLAAPAGATSDLEMSGGILGESTAVTISGNPGTAYLLLFSANEGPLPLALFDPAETRLVEVGLELFYLSVFLTGPTPANLSIPVPNDPMLLGGVLYTQALTLPGPGRLFDEVSNPSAVFLSAHGHSLDAPHDLLVTRSAHTATPLPGGDLLIAGGSHNLDLAPIGRDTAVILDHHRRRILPVANTMSFGRAYHSATALLDGRVLVAGGGGDAQGTVTDTTDLFDPSTGIFSPGPTMSSPRAVHAATRLQDGRVMLCGGTATFDPGLNILVVLAAALRSTDLYDPVSGTITRGANLPRRRIGHTATLLDDGRVLIHGGLEVQFILGIPVPSFPTTSLLYDPVADRYISSGQAIVERAWHTATKLSDGRVLVSGGFNGSILTLNLVSIPDVEIFDPTTGGGTWSSFAPLNVQRILPQIFERPDGSLLAIGGSNGQALGPIPTTEIERWDPQTRAWSIIGQLNTARGWHTASELPGEHVALVGGIDFAQWGIQEIEYYTF